MSNDSIEEEEEEDNQDRVRVGNDDRVRVGNEDRVRVLNDGRVRVLNDKNDEDDGRVWLPASDPGVDLEVDLGVDFDMANVGQEEFEEEMAQKEEVPEIWMTDGGEQTMKGCEESSAEWRRQQEEYQSEEKRRILVKIGGRELIEELEEKSRSWMNVCRICKAIGGERSKRCKGESLNRCQFVTENEKETMQLGMEGSRRI